MPAPAPRWLMGLFPSLKQLLLWFATITIVAIVAAAAASHFTRQDNIELAFKQEQLADIQKFQTGATLVDSTFRAFNDALVDGKGVDKAREAMRAAIAQHSSDTYALERVFGHTASSAYIDELGKLHDQIGDTTSPSNAMPMAQTAIDLIDRRRAMVKSAAARIGTD